MADQLFADLCEAYGRMERLWWSDAVPSDAPADIVRRHIDLQERFVSGETTDELRDDMDVLVKELTK